jgi:hypothetical protein
MVLLELTNLFSAVMECIGLLVECIAREVTAGVQVRVPFSRVRLPIMAFGYDNGSVVLKLAVSAQNCSDELNG